jgi:NitT/TauT family transport system permease protein
MTNELSIAQRQYLRSQKKHQRTVRIGRYSICILFLFLWEFTASSGIIDSFIFSSPSKIITCFITMANDGSIFLHTGITLFETLVSFALVLLFSLLFAILLWCSKKLSETLEPYLVILNSLPKSALAPLLIVWLGADYKTIILTGISVAVFGSIMSLHQGFEEVDPDKIKLIYTFGGNRRHVLTKVLLPANIPRLLSLAKVNIGLCLVGVVIGEFISSKCGLGYLIIYASQVFKMDWMLMSIVILCIISMAFYGLIGLSEKWCKKRMG